MRRRSSCAETLRRDLTPRGSRARRRDRAAEAAREPAFEQLAEEQADADADDVDQPGRDDEAGRVGGGIGGIRKLDAVGIAVEDREDGDQHQRHRLERPPGEGDGEAERQHRQRDPSLDLRQRQAGHAGNAAERHDERKRDRQRPHRAAAHLRAPDADRQHGKEMVVAEERMREAGQETAERALARMRGGRHR